MEIDIDLNKRIDWIKARVNLDALTEQYVRLQMQEAVIETVTKVKNLAQPDVIRCCSGCGHTLKIHSNNKQYCSNTKCNLDFQ